MRTAGFIWFASLMLAATVGQAEPISLLGDDPTVFDTEWESRGFPFIAKTLYEASMVSGEVVVTGVSDNAARAIARRIGVFDPDKIKLSWSWRVRSQLDGRVDERTRAGDDFAARVFVIFETAAIPTRTRAINYVWSAREPVGDVFSSPYTDQVAYIVLQNADVNEDPMAWRAESRDVLNDYREFFGESPSVVTAVAIMVDTDNTDGYAEADFRQLQFEINPAPDGSP